MNPQEFAARAFYLRPPLRSEARIMASPTQVPAASDETKVLSWVMLFVAFSAGAAVEIFVAQYGHRREAWDSPLYWRLGWPAMVAAGFVCGAIARRREWLIGYAPFLGNFVTMMLRTGVGSLWPLGLILTGIIGSPSVAAAYLGSRLGRRWWP